MSLPWIRLDTSIADHPKVLQLVSEKKHRAVLTYVLGLTYSGRHELDGFLPQRCLPIIHGTRNDAQALVEVGLWELAPGGWQINSWDEFQISSDETKRRRQRAQDAAKKRWNGAAAE